MKLEGRDLLSSGVDETATEYQVSSWPLPLTFQVGVAWEIWGKGDAVLKNDDMGALVVLDGQHINEGLTRMRAGFEYNFEETVSLRLGRVFDHDTETWSFGIGFRVPVTSYLFNAHFALADLGELDAVHRISLQISRR